MASCLGECGIQCHSRFEPGCLQHGRGDSLPPFRTHPPHKTLLLLRSSLPRAKKHSFSAKSDSPTSTTRRSDVLRRSKRGSTKFNTFAESIFLRLPRSCRVAEKSDPIGSREPNCAVFQQITTVVHSSSTLRCAQTL